MGRDPCEKSELTLQNPNAQDVNNVIRGTCHYRKPRRHHVATSSGIKTWKCFRFNREHEGAILVNDLSFHGRPNDWKLTQTDQGLKTKWRTDASFTPGGGLSWDPSQVRCLVWGPCLVHGQAVLTRTFTSHCVGGCAVVSTLSPHTTFYR